MHRSPEETEWGVLMSANEVEEKMSHERHLAHVAFQ